MIIPVNISVFVCERNRSYEKCLLMNGLIIAIPAFIYLLHFSRISFYTPISLLADRNPLLKGTSSLAELIIDSMGHYRSSSSDLGEEGMAQSQVMRHSKLLHP